MNTIGWENLMQIARELRTILPRKDNNADTGKARRTSSPIAGAEAMWQVRCNLAVRASDARLALGRKMRIQTKIGALLLELKKMLTS